MRKGPNVFSKAKGSQEEVGRGPADPISKETTEMPVGS